MRLRDKPSSVSGKRLLLSSRGGALLRRGVARERGRAHGDCRLADSVEDVGDNQFLLDTKKPITYAAAFFSFPCCPFNFAHLTFCAVAILRRAAALMWRGLGALGPFSFARRARWAAAIRVAAGWLTVRALDCWRLFAHLARWAAAIRARAAAENLLLGLRAPPRPVPFRP